MTIKFEVESDEKVKVIKDGKLVGHIFSPAGSGNSHKDCIQVCGFSDVFEIWSCGEFKGFKDIQMYFGDFPLKGKFTTSFDKCLRCYHDPCQCKELIVEDRYDDVIQKRVLEKV